MSESLAPELRQRPTKTAQNLGRSKKNNKKAPSDEAQRPLEYSDQGRIASEMDKSGDRQPVPSAATNPAFGHAPSAAGQALAQSSSNQTSASRKRSLGGEGATVVHQSCDGDKWRESLNRSLFQEGSQFNGDGSRFETRTAQDRRNQPGITTDDHINGPYQQRNANEYYPHQPEQFKHARAPKSSHTIGPADHVGGSQQLFLGQEFFRQRKASQASKGSSQGRSHEAQNERPYQQQARSVYDNPRNKKVKFINSSYKNSNQDLQQWQHGIDDYQSSTNKTVQIPAAVARNGRRRRGVNRSIHIEERRLLEPYLLAEQSQVSTTTKQTKLMKHGYNIKARAREGPYDPFECNSMPAYLDDYRDQSASDATIRDQQVAVAVGNGFSGGPSSTQQSKIPFAPIGGLVVEQDGSCQNWETPDTVELSLAHMPKSQGRQPAAKEPAVVDTVSRLPGHPVSLAPEPVKESTKPTQGRRQTTPTEARGDHSATPEIGQETIAPAFENGQKGGLEIQPRVIEENNQDQLAANEPDRRPGATQFANTGCQTSKPNNQRNVRALANMSKVSYLLDDDNIFTVSSHHSQSKATDRGEDQASSPNIGEAKGAGQPRGEDGAVGPTLGSQETLNGQKGGVPASPTAYMADHSAVSRSSRSGENGRGQASGPERSGRRRPGSDLPSRSGADMGRNAPDYGHGQEDQEAAQEPDQVEHQFEEINEQTEVTDKKSKETEPEATNDPAQIRTYSQNLDGDAGQDARDQDRVSQKSVQVGLPSIEEPVPPAPIEQRELACQTSSFLNSTRAEPENQVEEKQAPLLTISQEPIMTMCANTEDTKPADRGKEEADEEQQNGQATDKTKPTAVDADASDNEDEQKGNSRNISNNQSQDSPGVNELYILPAQSSLERNKELILAKSNTAKKSPARPMRYSMLPAQNKQQLVQARVLYQNAFHKLRRSQQYGGKAAAQSLSPKRQSPRRNRRQTGKARQFHTGASMEGIANRKTKKPLPTSSQDYGYVPNSRALQRSQKAAKKYSVLPALNSQLQPQVPQHIQRRAQIDPSDSNFLRNYRKAKETTASSIPNFKAFAGQNLFVPEQSGIFAKPKHRPHNASQGEYGFGQMPLDQLHASVMQYQQQPVNLVIQQQALHQSNPPEEIAQERPDHSLTKSNVPQCSQDVQIFSSPPFRAGQTLEASARPLSPSKESANYEHNTQRITILTTQEALHKSRSDELTGRRLEPDSNRATRPDITEAMGNQSRSVINFHASSEASAPIFAKEVAATSTGQAGSRASKQDYKTESGISGAQIKKGSGDCGEVCQPEYLDKSVQYTQHAPSQVSGGACLPKQLQSQKAIEKLQRVENTVEPSNSSPDMVPSNSLEDTVQHSSAVADGEPEIQYIPQELHYETQPPVRHPVQQEQDQVQQPHQHAIAAQTVIIEIPAYVPSVDSRQQISPEAKREYSEYQSSLPSYGGVAKQASDQGPILEPMLIQGPHQSQFTQYSVGDCHQPSKHTTDGTPDEASLVTSKTKQSIIDAIILEGKEKRRVQRRLANNRPSNLEDVREQKTREDLHQEVSAQVPPDKDDAEAAQVRHQDAISKAEVAIRAEQLTQHDIIQKFIHNAYQGTRAEPGSPDAVGYTSVSMTTSILEEIKSNPHCSNTLSNPGAVQMLRAVVQEDSELGLAHLYSNMEPEDREMQSNAQASITESRRQNQSVTNPTASNQDYVPSTSPARISSITGKSRRQVSVQVTSGISNNKSNSIYGAPNSISTKPQAQRPELAAELVQLEVPSRGLDTEGKLQGRSEQSESFTNTGQAQCPTQPPSQPLTSPIKSETVDLPSSAYNDLETVQRELESTKNREIQDLSKRFLQQCLPGESQEPALTPSPSLEQPASAFEREERELLLQRQQIIQEKDKIIQQLKHLETEKKENQMKKRRTILEAEKENLRQDLNELDQLKDLLRIMQLTKDKPLPDVVKEVPQNVRQVAAVKQRTEDCLTRSDAPDVKKDQGVAQDKAGVASRGQSAGTNCKGYAADQENETIHNNWLAGSRGQSSPNLQSAPKVAGPSANSQSALGPPIRASTESQENDGGLDASKGEKRKSHEPDKSIIISLQPHYDPDDQIISEPDSPEASRYQYEYYEEESEEEREELYARLAEPFERPKQIAAVQSIDQAKLAKHPSRNLPPLEIPGDPYSQKERTKQAQEPKLTPLTVTQTFLSASGLFDWHQSKVMQDVKDKRGKFYSHDSNHYNEDEIVHLIEQIKKNQMQSAEFKPENLHIVFKKAFQTLAELMNTLNQKQLFEMIAKKYTEVTHENTAKLLVRCKQLLSARQLAYKTLKGLATFERSVKAIRQDIDKYLDSNTNSAGDLARLTSQLAQLPVISKQIIDSIAILRDRYRLFNSMVAITSKGHQVFNAMAYRRRDAMRFVIKEYEGIKRLAQVVDHLEGMPVIQAK